jgi:hypothetical protein
LRTSFGLGVVVIFFLAVLVWLLKLQNLVGAIDTFVLLFGVWGVVTGLLWAKREDLYYFLGWGFLLSSLSSAYYISLRYALALAIILEILVIVFSRAKPFKPQASSPVKPAETN